MSSLQNLLNTFRTTAKTEREKGTYFERLVQMYLRNEPKYQDLYQQVWMWEEWRADWIAKGNQDPGKDTGIDLVALTHLGEFHAIQAKFWDEDRTLYKKDVDSFFTASGKKPFTYRVIVFSTDKLSDNLKDALIDQTPPVTTIALADLENSKIDWEQTFSQAQPTPSLKLTKNLRPYQETAIHNVTQGLVNADRGKLIMACGTGKTFTALRMSEKMAGKGGRVLFLVPSLNLLSQTLTEWTQESAFPLHSYAVCSDSEVGKKRGKGDDDFQLLAHELQYPATTNAKQLAKAFLSREDSEHMSVVFSTYHSIETISEAQKLHQLPEFDLIVCDEAHRTTGATFEGEEESNFVKIHNSDFIKGTKRVYMTATPRVYGVQAKAKAENDSIELYSMDKPEYFGETLHTITFSEAVHNLQVLCDYKVIVLTISEDHISKSLQKLLADEDNSLRVADAAKIVGCWRALSKMDSQEDLEFDPEPMKRAVAFAQVIELNQGSRTHKVSSKHIAAMFQKVVDAYREELKNDFDTPDEISNLMCEARHVDGGMGAGEKNQALDWLKAETPESTCRILSNVRCLSEGVDVPALDAVLFLTPRNSQVDVVQSVGRVMRKDPKGKKKLGYVILPVVIPAGVTPEEALNDNKTYKVVWEVLQALRSHDDRFDAMINKLDLTGQDPAKMEVIAVTDNINRRSKSAKDDQKKGKNTDSLGKSSKKKGKDTGGDKQLELAMEFGEIERAIIAKVVQKVGNRLYWDEWASDIARIAQTHISRITAILDTPENTAEIAAFDQFLDEIQDDLNDSITRAEAIEMLAQHIITKPVFDALFEGYSFTNHNPVSVAMQGVLDVLDKHNLDKEADTLTKFYESVRMRAAGITEVRAKQKIIVELYDKFFRNAFPRLVEKLGIVYTPVEVVDFIIHSINDALQQEFGQTLGDKGVHIIDPFTGTGTFITRLLQSGLISKDQLAYKYQQEIHANEIVLLAYYIAAINIEQVYHDIMDGEYVPFSGICLTDTFALHEKEDLVSAVLTDNSERRKRQKNLDIRVIMGNPPYSAWQTSANDNNANVEYPSLDCSIRRTYAEASKATNKNALYDSYIRAIRWASDRIGESGVIGFVSNAGFVEANTADGLRKCLAEEFSTIYIFHLRGNQRTSGELSKREGGKIFGSGSRAPIAISILIKNPQAKEHGKILFHDIGDYLSQQEKLEQIETFRSIQGITEANGWQPITPDQHHDWINQRDDSFGEHISLGDKKDKASSVLFENYSCGIQTNRDAWCYNSSHDEVSRNMKRFVDFYNGEVDRYQLACLATPNTAEHPKIEDFVSNDNTKIKWSSSLLPRVERGAKQTYSPDRLIPSQYRPFSKQWLYFDTVFNHRPYQMPRIFSSGRAENLVICVTGRGATKDFCAFVSSIVPDLEMVSKGQCFPFKLYEVNNVEDDQQDSQGSLNFAAASEATTKYTVKDGITDAGLAHFQDAYPSEQISKEDLFYYVYGLLHSEDYKSRYADNLTKELPRIPRVKTAADFWAFSKAGRALADLHINYETVDPYPIQYQGGNLLINSLTAEDFRVQQMKFAKGKNGEKHDKSTVIYNHKITMTGIPVEAYNYVVNGKPALEWVIERQAVSEHKDSGIVNDANLWATETMNDPAYPLKLFQRVITVSLKTLEIVKALPRL
ncbi:DEAD/DEAH box helicase family protein [Leeia sp. TBRC 13508]|uniref:DEAD/DEAH box helicase family protein n=1 Tax=Leeia speluncae TaxID=2884804 RepID=A0ABS8DA94_9NEIS|nr:type ISP restriction/modification enzyme [Leeia speluncae]MCB6185089.1 DEAD/DEAH box helicase family protein [Leeia speluncae]